jgi:NhaP-type Na+/H+ or K+/H+ antiporter
VKIEGLTPRAWGDSSVLRSFPAGLPYLMVDGMYFAYRFKFSAANSESQTKEVSEMFDCMLKYLASQWWWLAIITIIAMIIGWFAGGWLGVLIGFGFGVAVAVGFALSACQRR